MHLPSGISRKLAIHLNDDLMSKMRPQMEPYYYDSRKYDTYLDQLGVKFPTLTRTPAP